MFLRDILWNRFPFLFLGGGGPWNDHHEKNRQTASESKLCISNHADSVYEQSRVELNPVSLFSLSLM